jgi:deoxyadenosine/deoxycytidine kinase
MPIITIDGNIGCGKTSILNYLHKYYKIPVDLEPVDNWDKYLHDMYDDKQGVFKFQVRVWLDRCWVQEKSEKSIILMERSPHFIKNVFIRTAYDLKMISEKERESLLALHKNTDKMWCPNFYIYLRSKPENCCKKIKKRNRPSEKNITPEYIKILHDIHEETFENYDLSTYSNNTKMICIDVDGKTVVEVSNEILEIIQTHFPTHKYI